MPPEGREVYEAARLVAYAVRVPAARPAKEREYADLLDRYDNDAGFRGLVDEIAAAFDLLVASTGPYGVVLEVAAESPFAFRIDDLHERMDVEQRLSVYLIAVGLIAYLYPTNQALEDLGATRYLTVTDLHDYLKQRCATLRASSPDPVAGAEQVTEAWRAFDLLKPATAQGLRRWTTALGRIERVVGEFARHGLLEPDGQIAGEQRYRALERLRLQARNVAADVLYQALVSLPPDASEVRLEGAEGGEGVMPHGAEREREQPGRPCPARPRRPGRAGQAQSRQGRLPAGGRGQGDCRRRSASARQAGRHGRPADQRGSRCRRAAGRQATGPTGDPDHSARAACRPGPRADGRPAAAHRPAAGDWRRAGHTRRS